MFFFSDLRNYWNECNCNVVGIYWIVCQMHGLIIAKLKPNKIIAKMLTGNAVLGLKSDRLDRDWCVSCKVSKASSETWIKPLVQSGPSIFDQSESFLSRTIKSIVTCFFSVVLLEVSWSLQSGPESWTILHSLSRPGPSLPISAAFLWPDLQNNESIKSPTKDQTTEQPNKIYLTPNRLFCWNY